MTSHFVFKIIVFWFNDRIVDYLINILQKLVNQYLLHFKINIFMSSIIEENPRHTHVILKSINFVLFCKNKKKKHKYFNT